MPVTLGKLISMRAIWILLVVAFTTIAVSAPAQDNKEKKDEKVKVAVYSCPMHPDEKSDKPGKCSKCGMDLAKTPKEKMKMKEMNSYRCPMHPDEKSDKPGKCSKCGMDMTQSPKEKMKMKEMHGYSCPMHPDEKSDKPGKCSKCGMALKEVKEKAN